MAARRARDRRGDAHGAEARGALTSPLSRAARCLPHLLSHPLAPLACPSQPLVSEWIDLVRENKREKEADQIANVLRDLGPMPDPDDADDLALWTAALVNPLPALGVAVEIRPLVRYPPPHLHRSISTLHALALAYATRPCTNAGPRGHHSHRPSRGLPRCFQRFDLEAQGCPTCLSSADR